MGGNKNRASSRMIFRILIAVYFVYLDKQLIEGLVKKDSTMPTWLMILFILIFAGFAVWMVVYSIKQYKIMTQENENTDQKQITGAITEGTEQPGENTAAKVTEEKPEMNTEMQSEERKTTEEKIPGSEENEKTGS